MHTLRHILRIALLVGGVLLVAGLASATPPDFHITSLGSSATVNPSHDSITGDDRGGIAVSASRLFYSGDSATGAFDKNTLSGSSTGYMYDGLVNDLATGKVYTLAYYGSPIGQSGWVNQLVEIDPTTGAQLATTISFSSSIYLYSGGGVYSGYNQVILHTYYDLYSVEIPTGTMTYLGSPFISRTSCESWGNWGVAEQISGQAWVASVSGNSIIRTRASDGATQTIASFSSLSDMCSFTMSLADNRWYFHHEGASQFAAGGTEVVGYAPATWSGPAVGGSVIFFDDFNDGTIDSGRWSSWRGASESSMCGATSAPYALTFTGTAPRYAATKSLSIPSGATVQFQLLLTFDSSGSCEGPDAPGEDVHLQYSTNGGSTWTEIAEFAAGQGGVSTGNAPGGYAPIVVPLPPGAATTSTMLRWIQNQQTIGDAWAIDDVLVQTGAPVPVNPVSFDAPTNVATQGDQDSDGVADEARIEMTRVTVGPGGVTTQRQPSADVATGIDPDADDNSNPKPVVTQGPFSTVTSNCGGEADRVCYKVGASFRWMGLDIPGVVEGTQDANALPFTLPVDTPTGALPTNGPDNDGDGIPSRLSVPMERVTIRADGTLNRAPAPAQQVAADTDDTDPTNPKPAVTRGPFATVTPNCVEADRVCYLIGADVRWMGTDVFGVQEGSQDANALPFTLPADTPTGALPVVGPDADGDGVPSHLLVAMERVAILSDGSIDRAPAATAVVPVDPDDGDPLNPIPGGWADLAVAPGCAQDEVCASVEAQARAAGQDAGASRGESADAGPATDAAADAAGWRVVMIDGAGGHVLLPATGVSKETPALAPATPLESVSVGPGSVAFTREAGLVVTAPVVGVSGIVTTHAGGQTVSEPTMLVALQDLLLAFVPAEVVAPLPSVNEGLP